MLSYDRPRGQLATLLSQAGVPSCNADAGLAYAHMRKPGRHGAKSVINFHLWAPYQDRPALIAEMHERRVNRSGFGAALARQWTEAGYATARAASTPERLASWFRYALFDLPWIKAQVDVGVLPERVTVYRGGRGDPAAVGAGLSWSPSRRMAAWYAHSKWQEWACPGDPLLLSREITRDQALAYFALQGGEVVVNGPGLYELDTCDAAEIAALAAEAEPEIVAFRKEAERYHAIVMATPEEELWEGWEG